MSDELLRRAGDVLWELLSSTDPIAPTDLLVRAAEKREPGLTAEILRIALWALLSRGSVVQTGDHRLLRATADVGLVTTPDVAFA